MIHVVLLGTYKHAVCIIEFLERRFMLNTLGDLNIRGGELLISP